MASKVRLYRVGPTPSEVARIFAQGGDMSDWVRVGMARSGSLAASGRWFTSDRDEAADYSRHYPMYALRHVEVSVEDAAKWKAADNPVARLHATHPEHDYYLPAWLADLAEPSGPED